MDGKERYCIRCMQRLREDGTCACGFHSEEWERESYPETLEPGRVLNGKFLVGLPLGAGGFGITYIGRDLNLDMRVAIKEYKDTAEEGRRKFLQEARTLARFAGKPGIVNVRDFFEENGTAYIVMEYIDGMTLKEAIDKSGPMEIGTVLSLLKILDGANNRISSIEPLSGCTALETVDISGNQIDSLEALSGCSSLKGISCSHNQITGLEGLENKAELCSVMACDNQIQNISPLTGSPKLTYVDLGRNKITGVSAFQNHEGLKALLLESNHITSIAGLSSKNRYMGLTLYDNPLEDISAFSGFAPMQGALGLDNAEGLYLSYSDKLDYSVAAECQVKIKIVDTPIEKQKAITEAVLNGSSSINKKPEFLTKEEADKKVDSFRESLEKEMNNLGL